MAPAHQFLISSYSWSNFSSRRFQACIYWIVFHSWVPGVRVFHKLGPPFHLKTQMLSTTEQIYSLRIIVHCTVLSYLQLYHRKKWPLAINTWTTQSPVFTLSKRGSRRSASDDAKCNWDYFRLVPRAFPSNIRETSFPPGAQGRACG